LKINIHKSVDRTKTGPKKNSTTKCMKECKHMDFTAQVSLRSVPKIDSFAKMLLLLLTIYQIFIKNFGHKHTFCVP